ncbi:MAG: carboxypeptidase-like regulatory domain-containing protein [Pyrinomonadaceae bacterium]
MTIAQSAAPYTLTGELRDDAGQLFSGAKVCAIPTDGTIVRVRDRICAHSDQQGKFEIDLTSAGKYQVIAEKISEGYMPSYIPFYRDPKIPIPEAIVGDQNSNPSLSLVLGPKSGLISGKVVDEASDVPVRGFMVWVYQARTANAHIHEIVKGSRSGRFRIFAPPVPFRLRVVAEGYEDWVMGGGVLVSAGGVRKAPGSLLVRTGTADFAVYLKRKNSLSLGSARVRNNTRLRAPVQLSPQDNDVFDIVPRNTTLAWSPVAGAVSYGLEVESCWNVQSAERSRLPDDGECINPSPYDEKFALNGTTYEFIFKGAQPSRWRVWAIDKDHRPGFKSAWRRFVYLR